MNQCKKCNSENISELTELELKTNTKEIVGWQCLNCCYIEFKD